jgi:hypothetical protein
LEFLTRNPRYKVIINVIKTLGLPANSIDIENETGLTLTTGRTHRDIFTLEVKPTERKLNLSINLEAPNSLILAGLENLLNDIRREHDLPDRKLPWATFDTYLQILDLHQEGKSLEDIAKVAFPTEYKKTELNGNLDSLIRRVKRNLKRARQMAETGKLM